MASSKPPAKVLCKYYMSNCCFKGNLCPFSHDWKHKPDMVCKYYLKGECVNGKKCRYDHVKPKEVGVASSSHAPPVWSVKTVVPEPANLPSLSSSARTSMMSQPVALPPKKMVTLQDNPSRNPKKWVQAAEFVPGQPFHGPPSKDSASSANVRGGKGGTNAARQVQGSYSNALGIAPGSYMDVISAEEAASLLCPFAEMGHCPFEVCEYLHGDVCDMCNRQCLNPFDPEQQKAHKKDCLAMHEREMEKAFQAQESEAKLCAICMECVINKSIMSERRFGILPNCEHCFCLACIRKWRDSRMNQTIRACPLCRVVSFFVIPSEVWIDDDKQKQKLVQEYKDNLGRKHCKYFNMGEGTCPFGTSCFYKHEYPDGRRSEETPRFIEGAEGEKKVVKTNTLWDYLDRREEETLDSLPQISAPVRNRQYLQDTRQEEVWLNYEPDIDDMEFL